MKKLTCKECEYSWNARKNALPKKCPNPRCQSFNWNGPSTYPSRVGKRGQRGQLEIQVPVEKVGDKVHYKITNRDLFKLSDAELEVIEAKVAAEEEWKR